MRHQTMLRATVLCAVALLHAGCSGGGAASSASPMSPSPVTPAPAPSPTPGPAPGPAPNQNPPVLSVSIVDLSGTYDAATKRLGSLKCSYRFATDPNDRWCFHAFGATYGPSATTSPSYDYKVVAGATVRAATAGIVTRIDDETNALLLGEFEVETRPTVDSDYLVIYDHVKNLTVSLGSTVTPGSVLGTAGIHTSDVSAWGRVELQVNRITQRAPTIQSVPVCPRSLGTAQFNAEADAALAAHNQENPSFSATTVCLAN